MKASSAVFVSILLFILSIVLFFYLSSAICLATCFASLAAILAVTLLIIGMVKHIRAKGLSEEDRRRRNMIPVSGSSLLEPFQSLADAVVRIYRNPRRTLAMLSGIIL